MTGYVIKGNESNDKYDKALIIVDMQNGFMNEYTKDLGTKIIELLDEFDGLKVALQFRNEDDSQFERKLHYNGMKRDDEIDLIDGIKDRVHFVKARNRCSYSGFEVWMSLLLKTREVKEVFIAGVDTDACVLATAFNLFDAEYDIKLLVDYCGSSGGQLYHDYAIELMKRNFGEGSIVYGDYKE